MFFIPFLESSCGLPFSFLGFLFSLLFRLVLSEHVLNVISPSSVSHGEPHYAFFIPQEEVAYRFRDTFLVVKLGEEEEEQEQQQQQQATAAAAAEEEEETTTTTTTTTGRRRRRRT